MLLICMYFHGYICNTSLKIVNILNIMSYYSVCTIRTIKVAVVHSICSQFVCEPARGPGTMNLVSTVGARWCEGVVGATCRWSRVSP